MVDSKKHSHPLRPDLPPHIASGESKNRVMMKTCVAMCIPAILGVAAIGWNALWQILIAVATVLVLHFIIQVWERSTERMITYPSPSSPLVLGMIVGLSMPASSPYAVTVGVAALAMVIFKYFQGRVLYRKYINPAAASKTVLLAILSIIILFEDPLRVGMIFHPHHLRLDMISAEGFANAVAFYQTDTMTAAQSLIFWKTHGWIGGASGVGVLITGVIASYWIKLKWRIPLAFLVVMTVLATTMGLFTGGDPVSRIALHVFTGSVIFLAFFMATEPQSTPMPERAQYLFGVLLAVFTFILQLGGVLGGSIIALVVLNVFTPLFDKFGHKRAVGLGGGKHVA